MHPLDGSRAKIERVKSQLKTLNSAFEGFFEKHPYSFVIAEFNRKTRYHSLRVKGTPPSFPNEWVTIP